MDPMIEVPGKDETTGTHPTAGQLVQTDSGKEQNDNDPQALYPEWLKPDRLVNRGFTRQSFLSLIACLSLALLLESLAYMKFAPGVFLASRLWLASGLTCLLGTVVLFVRLLYADLKERNWLTLLFPVLLAVILGVSISYPGRSVIGQDATQQLAAGLLSFDQPGWNYTGKAFLGYPNRQYVLAALPSLIFGRSEMSLRLGFALPFYAGLTIFWIGLRRWSSALRYGDLAAIAMTAAVLAFPYVTEYYLYSEQTLLPVCFTLQIIGWLLIWLRQPSLPVSLALAWSGTMLIHCYTPALAGVGLLILLLLGIGWNQLRQRKIDAANTWTGGASVAMAALVAGYLILSFASGRSDRVTLLRSLDPGILLSAAKTGLLIALTNRPAVYAGLLLPVVLIYLAGSLAGLFKWLHAAIALWLLAVVVLSQVLQGYAIYPPQISFSRTLITVPVLCAAVFLLVCARLRPKESKIEDKEPIGQAEEPAPTGKCEQAIQTEQVEQTVADQQVEQAMIEQTVQIEHQIEEPAVFADEQTPSHRPTWLARFQSAWQNRLLPIGLIAFCCLCLSIGTVHLFRPFVQGDAAKYFNEVMLNPMRLLMHDVNQAAALAGYDSDDMFDLVICTDIVWLKNPRDYTQYFFPQARVTVLGREDPLPEQITRVNGGLIYLIDVNRDDLIDENRLVARTRERRDMQESVFEFVRIIVR
jgi:hypothetical protein